jgi:hypothetical protein
MVDVGSPDITYSGMSGLGAMSASDPSMMSLILNSPDG